MRSRPDLFQFLQNPRLQDLLAVVPLETARDLGFPITKGQHQTAQRRLDDRIRAEVLPWLTLRLMAPVREAYTKGLDRNAFRRWFLKQQEKKQFQTIPELIAWVDNFSVPDSLRGKLKRGAELPGSLELLKQFEGFEEKARRAATKAERFIALQGAFPEVSSSFLRRFEIGRFYPRRFAKEAAAHYYHCSVKTIERHLKKARQKTANTKKPTARRSA